MKSVVLSNEAQYQAFLLAGYRLADFAVYCDNTDFYIFLKQKGVAFEALDEFLFQAQWAEINEFGCGRANDWLRLCADKKIFSGANLASVVRLFFSHILVSAAKNQLYAKKILDRKPSELVTFKKERSLPYPNIDGNFYLNFFLEGMARERALPVQVVLMRDASGLSEKDPGGLSSRDRFKRSVKWALDRINGILNVWPRPVEVLAFGSLRHLGDALLALRKRGCRAALYDFEVHSDIWKFCQKNGLPYWVRSQFERPWDGANIQAIAQRNEREMSLAIQKGGEAGFFRFQGYDLSPLLQNGLLPAMGPYLRHVATDEKVFERLLSFSKAQVCLVDEDYAYKGGFFSAYALHKGRRIYCISHANYSVNYSVPEGSRTFAQSVTFVHSEYEKEMYAKRGWDPSKLVITGVPRYDRLAEAAPSLSRTNGPVKVLFPATVPYLHSPDKIGYLGEHFFCWGNVSVGLYPEIVRSMEGLPIELTVKPHSEEYDSFWRDYSEKVKSSVPIKTVTGSQDFFELLRQTDVVVISYMSTAILDAALAGKPVIFVHDQRHEGFPIGDYEDNRLVRFVTGGAALAEELKTVCASGAQSYKDGRPFLRKEYFLGRADGRSSDRVADAVIQGVREAKERVSC